MNVRLRLLATLRPYGPAGMRDGEVMLELPEGATPKQVIARLGIPPELASLVMIDGHHQLPDELGSRALKEGETLAIAPPIAGG